MSLLCFFGLHLACDEVEIETKRFKISDVVAVVHYDTLRVCRRCHKTRLVKR